MRFPHFPLGSVVCSLSLAVGLGAATGADAAAPGITAATLSGSSSTFNLTAAPNYITQPDGMSIYSWGYGCTANSAASFAPASMGAASGAQCPTMQVPGPTLIVNQGDTVTVTLTNNLPNAAGNTSILFPGFNVTATGGANGLLTKEAPVGGTVTYTFVANSVGTHSYYSGTQGDIQVEMGLYGAIIVLPTLSGGLPTGYSTWHLAQGAHQPDTCTALNKKPARASNPAQPETDYRLSSAAYDNPNTCYDREYLFQLSEIDPAIHQQVESQKDVACLASTGCLVVKTQPYHPAYYLVNGRSMPDDMDPNYVSTYPHQPYNGNPHMHPGELTLLRIIGQGHEQHPLHEHANHVRLLARDGNLLLTQSGDNKLAGPLLFTTTTSPGQALDGIFQFTGKNLNWDVYGHGVKDGQRVDSASCNPDANGYYTTASSPAAATTADNYYEWCPDHLKALESKPFGQVGEGGPVTLPDPNILANGTWYSGSPYLGPEATARAVGLTPIPPFGTVGNDPGAEAGFAFMWHSHNEREITTNNIFPGGMMMMMLVDPWVYLINESN